MSQHVEWMSKYSAEYPMTMEVFGEYSAINNVRNVSFLDFHPRCLIGIDALIRVDQAYCICYACDDRCILEDKVIEHLLSPSHIFRYMVDKFKH